jgi:ribosomal protein L7Ae-like RNA K-turn-binding protein
LYGLETVFSVVGGSCSIADMVVVVEDVVVEDVVVKVAVVKDEKGVDVQTFTTWRCR